MTGPLMPKSAVWLLDQYSFNFSQISEYCNLLLLEVQAIADGEVNQGIIRFNQ